MSSALQSGLTSLQQNNYVSLAMLTAVLYDYVLTFSDEIEYIWTKPWTSVSTLFILVRYGGLYSFAISCLGEIIYIIGGWTFVLFLGAADFAMILRVWAMYNRSRLILRMLLMLFSLEIIPTIAGAAIYSNPRYLSISTIQILDFSFCAWQPILPVFTEVLAILQMAYGAAICILAIAQFVKQSVQMYRVTRQWQFNQFMKLFVNQGILYFLFIFLFNFVDVLTVTGGFPSEGWKMVLLFILEQVPVYTLTPRFILSVRELYARDVQCGRGEGIDTGFGLSSWSGGVGGAGIVFADVEQNEEGLEGVEGISMEVGTTRPE